MKNRGCLSQGVGDAIRINIKEWLTNIPILDRAIGAPLGNIRILAVNLVLWHFFIPFGLVNYLIYGVYMVFVRLSTVFDVFHIESFGIEKTRLYGHILFETSTDALAVYLVVLY